MPEWKYTVLFETTSPAAPTDAEVDELVELLSDEHPSAGELPAGYTYFGQFVVHDVSFQHEKAGPGTLIDRLFSPNTPALDLDSIYGQGLVDPKIPFDNASGAFVLDRAGSGANEEKDRDLPRTEDLQARIGDPRNDDNLLVAQMQVLFMRFHNRIVQDLRALGVHDRDFLFLRAKEDVVKTYQYLVLHDYLRNLVPEAVYEAVVVRGRGALSTPNEAAPTMALEFVDAASRLHSLVRPSYAINDRRNISFGRMVELTGQEKTASSPKPLLERDDVVDWRHFFEFANDEDQTPWQRANAISPVVNPSMRDLKDQNGRRIDMLKTNIRKAIGHGLCTGQEACEALQKRFPTLSKKLKLKPIRNNVVLGKLQGNSIRTRTPLWVYLMLEAAQGKMGVLGGWIIADALRTAALNSAIRLSRPSQTQPTELYEPLRELAANRNAKRITIEDVITYTYH